MSTLSTKFYADKNCTPPTFEARLAGRMTVGPRPYLGDPLTHVTPAAGPNRKQRRAEAAQARYFGNLLAKYLAHHPDTPYKDAVKIVEARHAR